MIRENDICISQLPKYYDYVKYLIDAADNEYQRLLCRYGIDNHTRHYMTIDIKRLAHIPETTKIEEIYLKDLIVENIKHPFYQKGNMLRVVGLAFSLLLQPRSLRVIGIDGKVASVYIPSHILGGFCLHSENMMEKYLQ